MMWRGEEILVLTGADGQEAAVLVDVDDNCALKVRYENGACGLLTSGEIAIRRKL